MENFIHDKFGYCYYAIESDKIPIIFNLYVEPEYRKQGHARKYLQYVINEIRKTGYNGIIEIEVNPRDKSKLIGKGGKNINMIRKLARRHHPIRDVQII